VAITLTLYGHIQPQSNGPLYSSTVIGTLAICYRAAAPPSPLIAVPNVTAYQSTATRNSV